MNPVERLGLSTVAARRYLCGNEFDYKGFLKLAQRFASTQYGHFYPDRRVGDSEAALHFKDVQEAQKQLERADPAEQKKIVDELLMPLEERVKNLCKESLARISAIDRANEERVKRYLQILADLALGSSYSARGLRAGKRLFVLNPQDAGEYLKHFPDSGRKKNVENLELAEREDGVIFVGKISPNVMHHYVTDLGECIHLQEYLSSTITDNSVITVKSDKEKRASRNTTFVYEINPDGSIKVFNTEQDYPIITRNIRRYKLDKNEILVKQRDLGEDEKEWYFNRFNIGSVNAALTEKLKGCRIIGGLVPDIFSLMRNLTDKEHIQAMKEYEDGVQREEKEDKINLFGIQKRLEVPGSIFEFLKKEYTIDELSGIISISALGLQNVFSSQPHILSYELLVACKKTDQGEVKFAILGRLFKMV